MGILRPQSNGPLYIKPLHGTLAVDGLAATFGTARWGLGALRPPTIVALAYYYYVARNLILIYYPPAGIRLSRDGWLVTY